MKNSQFVLDCKYKLGNEMEKEKRHGSLYFSDGILYSYGLHYPLAFKCGNTYFRNTEGYSSTTGKHIGYAGMIAVHDINIPNNTFNGWNKFEPTKATVKKILNDEKKQLERGIKELSTRAWRQKLNKEKRIEEILLAINAI